MLGRADFKYRAENARDHFLRLNHSSLNLRSELLYLKFSLEEFLLINCKNIVIYLRSINFFKMQKIKYKNKCKRIQM